MKVLINKAEYEAILGIMRTADSTTASIEDCLKNNPLIDMNKISISIDTNSTKEVDAEYELNVDAEYLAEYLNAFQESSGIVIPLVKSAYAAVKAFMGKVDAITMKHVDKRLKKKQATEKARNKCKEEIKRTHSFVFAYVNSFQELCENTRDILTHTYGPDVETIFNEIIEEMRKEVIHNHFRQPF